MLFHVEFPFLILILFLRLAESLMILIFMPYIIHSLAPLLLFIIAMYSLIKKVGLMYIIMIKYRSNPPNRR